MPLEDLSGMTVLGKSTEAYLAERAEEERRQSELYHRLKQLNQLMVEFQRIRVEHDRLKEALDQFGRTLGLVEEVKLSAT